MLVFLIDNTYVRLSGEVTEGEWDEYCNDNNHPRREPQSAKDAGSLGAGATGETCVATWRNGANAANDYRAHHCVR